MIADDVAVSGVLSVTVTVKITAPTAVGLPEINPVVGFNVKPVGRCVPAPTAHVV